MKLKIRTLFLLLLAFSMTLACQAQQISIKKVFQKKGDTTAQDNPCKDNNDNICALVIIDAGDLQGLRFPNANQYIKSETVGGKYYVYIPEGMNRLSYGHESYARGEIDFKEWGQRKLKGGLTYEVLMEAPKLSELQSKVVFKISPADASLMVDGNFCQLDSTGICEMAFADGNHNYMVEKTNFNSEHGAFSISGSDSRTITVNMKPQMVNVDVVCKKNNASVFIDDIYYGKPGSLMMPKGEHKLRVQANKYLDYEDTVNVTDSTQAITVDLKENNNQVDVHAVPVTINSHSNRIFVNNRRVKEWEGYGTPILLMPDKKYRITDALNHKKMIKVERNMPMEVDM